MGQNFFKWALGICILSIGIYVAIYNTSLRKKVIRTIYYSYYQSNEHVIIFDAGSTGTRIHIFEFHPTSSDLILEEAFFDEIKPGLSDFADDPLNAASSIGSLLDKAMSYLPTYKWNNTFVSLKATAGLRLLPTNVKNSILEQVLNRIEQSPFKSDFTSVSVLDGKDEGLFAWFTLNFLLEKLKEPEQSVAALDLGGGSTQVTFAATYIDTFLHLPEHYILHKKIKNKNFDIYSTSYLGFGLMSARFSIMYLTTNLYAHFYNFFREEEILVTSCIYPGERFTWKHNFKEYIIEGKASSGIEEFTSCYHEAVYFLSNQLHRPNELSRKDIYALSYYFDVAFDLNIIGPQGGLVIVEDFMNAGKAACSKSNKELPFLCLDSAYISALLHHSLGLSKDKTIMLVKQINGIEASWGLGAAFDLLLNQFNQDF